MNDFIVGSTGSQKYRRCKHAPVWLQGRLYSSKTSKPFLPFISINLFTLFCAGPHGIKDRTFTFSTEYLNVHGLKQGECTQVCLHPLGQVFDVRDGVYDATRTQDICILRQKGGGDYACLVLAQLEVWVREEEEERRERVFGKVVGQELHGIRADDRHVLISAGRNSWVGGRRLGRWCRRGSTKGRDPIFHVLRDLDANFKALRNSGRLEARDMKH